MWTTSDFKDIATRLTSNIPGTSAFLFGAADRPLLRGLVERRKAVKWFRGQRQSKYDGIKADVGPDPIPRYGLTGTHDKLMVPCAINS